MINNRLINLEVRIMFLTLHDQGITDRHSIAVHSHQLPDFIRVVGIVGQRFIHGQGE